MNELSQRAKIASSALSYFERDQRKPSADVLIRLADTLGSSVGFILGQEKMDEVSQEASAELEILHRRLKGMSPEEQKSTLRMFNLIVSRDDLKSDDEDEDDPDLK